MAENKACRQTHLARLGIKMEIRECRREAHCEGRKSHKKKQNDYNKRKRKKQKIYKRDHKKQRVEQFVGREQGHASLGLGLALLKLPVVGPILTYIKCQVQIHTLQCLRKTVAR